MDPPPEAPFPENHRRTVQSETEIAVLNRVGHDDDDDDDDDDDRFSSRGDDGDDDDFEGGKLMVAGYNDSWGFYNNRQGLSGYAYSINGGASWIDGGGLPPAIPAGGPGGAAGQDTYFGDPVVVVHHKSGYFWYSSLYQSPEGFATLSVNRGRFMNAPMRGAPHEPESKSNTRCANDPAKHGIPDVPNNSLRIVWEPPVVAVAPPFLGTNNDAFLDKEWLYVDQKTGVLYMTYTRFAADGSTPIELVRSFDGGQTWTPPTVIVPNEALDFNQATMPITDPTGSKVLVTWFARTFVFDPGPPPFFFDSDQRIESSTSNDGGNTFGPVRTVSQVKPQGEPKGYNRGRCTILNAPYVAVDKGRDDGRITEDERERRGFGNVYITYFDGKTPTLQPAQRTCAGSPATQSSANPYRREADIHVSRSRNFGTTYDARVKVNNDPGNTTHVFPSVQVSTNGNVYATWLDRRLDQAQNRFTDTWADVSTNRGGSFGSDVRVTNVSTHWNQRQDALPNFGDYNSSELLNFTTFASIWADGRFPTGRPNSPSTPPTRPGFEGPRGEQTPDSIFAVVKGLPGGGGDDDDDDDDD